MCPVALSQGRYTARHDRIIQYWIENKCDNGSKIYADIDGYRTHGGTIPPNLMVTEQRPDIVIHSPEGITLVELTVPFDTERAIADARLRKRSRYNQLECDFSDIGVKCESIYVEIGARGLITKDNKSALTYLARKLGISKVSNFIAMSGRKSLEGSRIIYNARNSPQW